MNKPVAVPPSGERVTIDYLTPALASRGQDATVGVNVPTAWVAGTKPHVQVGLDGTPEIRYPAMWLASMRVTVWHSSTTTAQALAALCQGLLLAHPGDSMTAGCLPGTGVLPTQDPDTKAQLASISVVMKLLGQLA